MAIGIASFLAGVILGVVVSLSAVSSVDSRTEKTGVWQHEGRVYRLIRIPSDAQN